MNAPQPAANASAAPQKKGIPVGLIAGVIALVVVLLLPLPDSLPPAGQRMLAILAFAVVVWLTEAVSYEASAIIITSLMAFLVGTAPT
ncbi:MAG TPA: anion permease, partial [Paraburkholderia sp.]|nr:anion permease [Paraburkholderia sp.]